MTRSGVQCVVFDIDDTLYLERDYVRSGFAAVGAWMEAHLGLTAFADRCWIAFESGSRRSIFDDVLRSYEQMDRVEPDLVAELVARYRRHPPAIRLLPDAEEALRRLSREFDLAAVSDGPLESQRAKVRVLGLADRLHPIVLTEELGPGHGKPHLPAFLLIEENLGIGGDRCVYVADNPQKDFEAPAALGWRTIRVRRPGGLHERTPSAPDVEVEVTNLERLDEILSSRVELSSGS